jgi:RNA polymerase sigma-70 factor, ECF subfamily
VIGNKSADRYHQAYGRESKTSSAASQGGVLMNPSEQLGSSSTVYNGSAKQCDESLLSAACSGDSQAFVELSKPHFQRTLLTLYRITKNWQDAEDALQEALMKAFMHLDSFQGKARFSTWFTSIAVNTALMLLRKRRGILSIATDSAGEVGASSAWDLKDSRENPEQSFERLQRAAFVQSAVMQLPQELRKVAELRYSQDLSYDEIAQRLGISLSAAKSRLLRARTAIREFVQREVCKSPVSSRHVWTKRLALPKNSDGDLKASPTRRKSMSRCSPDSIERKLVPLRAMSPAWEKAIHLGDEGPSPAGGV